MGRVFSGMSFVTCRKSRDELKFVATELSGAAILARQEEC